MSPARKRLKYGPGGLVKRALESPEFREWFAGSRALDKEGNPLIVYRGEHGPSSSSMQTRKGALSFGSKDAANTYAMEPNDYNDQAINPRVLMSFLKIKRPVIESPDDPFIDAQQLNEALGPDLTKKIVGSVPEAFEGTGRWQEELRKQGYDSPLDYLQKNPVEKWGELYGDAYPIFDKQELVDLFRQHGFDGVIHGGNGETALEPEYKVFDASQVRPAFDPVNKLESARRRLGYGVGGAVRAVRNFFTGINGSQLDRVLEDLKGRLPNVPSGDANAVAMDAAQQRWIERNVRNYLIKQHGTEGDPLKTVMQNGRGYQNVLDKRGAADQWADLVGSVPTPEHAVDPSAEWFKKAAIKDWPRYAAERAHGIDLGAIGYQPGEDALAKKLQEIDAKHAARNTPPVELYDIDPQKWGATLGPELHDALDYLRTQVDPRSLPQVSVPDAIRKSREWHAAMAKKAADADKELIDSLPVTKQYPNGAKWVQAGGDGAFNNVVANDDIDQRVAAMKSIGKALGHCYQDDATCRSYLSDSTLHTLIDPSGKPRVTVEVQPGVERGITSSAALEGMYGPEIKQSAEDWRAVKGPRVPFEEYVHSQAPEALENWRSSAPAPSDISQIRGPQNGRAPEDALPYLKDFIASGNYGDVEGAKDYGLKKIITQGGYPRWLDPEMIPQEYARYRIPSSRGAELVPADKYADYAAQGMLAGSIDAMRLMQAEKNPQAMKALIGPAKAKVLKNLPVPTTYSIPDDYTQGFVDDVQKKAGGGRVTEDLLDLARRLKNEIAGSVEGGTDIERMLPRYGSRAKAANKAKLQAMRDKTQQNLAAFGFHPPEKAASLVEHMLKNDDPLARAAAVAGDEMETAHQTTELGDSAYQQSNDRMERLAHETESDLQLPSGMLARLINRESAWNPGAVSKAGALGIMQFMPQTAAAMGIDPLDPNQAIPAGGEYLRYLHDKLGNWRDALAAYNWGEGNVLKYGYSHAPAETRKYVEAILPDPAGQAISSAKRLQSAKNLLANREVLPQAVHSPSGALPTPPDVQDAIFDQSQPVPRGTESSQAKRLTGPDFRSRMLSELDPDDALNFLMALQGGDEEDGDSLLGLLALLEGGPGAGAESSAAQ